MIDPTQLSGNSKKLFQELLEMAKALDRRAELMREEGFTVTFGQSPQHVATTSKGVQIHIRLNHQIGSTEY